MVPFARRALVRAAIIVSAALACVSLVPAAASANDPELDVQERWVLGEINRYRAEVGSPPLESSSSLSRAAGEYAQVLADHDTIDHNLGSNPQQRAEAVGLTAGLGGEALTIASAAGAAERWHNSPAHNAIMTDPRYHVAGVGTDRSHTTWVLMVANCTWVSPEVCANTHDTGDSSPDIYRILIEAYPSSIVVGLWCADARDPKPSACYELDDGATTQPAKPATTGHGHARKRAPKVRVSSVSQRGRTVTATVSVLRAAKGRLTVSATGFGWTAPARRVATKSSGRYVRRTYRVRVPRAGKYTINPEFAGSGAWGARLVQSGSRSVRNSRARLKSSRHRRPQVARRRSAPSSTSRRLASR
jgi:uncharacterized protein YkwD